jgi:hypothetical protein
MRRFFLAITGLAVAWALVIAVSGGFVVRLGAMRVSSRSPVNPLLIALAAGVIAWLLSPRGQRGRVLASDLAHAATGVRRLVNARWFPGLLAAILSVGIVMVGLVQGARVAGGSDAYGYVSQAEWWASGTFRFDEPLIREFAGRIAREALVPLAYLPIGNDGAIVPMYAPGLPLTMAAVQRIAGREAVFYVVPLLGGVAIFATYLMGACLAGRAVGLSAAVLLATSPSFLFQLTAAPMSDVPVTAWWALALALVLFESRRAAFASGLAAGAAILTRPNLVPLALIPAALLLWVWLAGALARRRHTAPEAPASRRAVQRMLLFAAGVIPGCVTVGALNAAWYGSPLMSGYGSLSAVYDWHNIVPNLLRYPKWVVESQTPIVLAAFAAPWLIGRITANGAIRSDARLVAASWLCFSIAVLASYVLYQTFEAWWFVRFLLPAYPPLLVLTSVTMLAASARLPLMSRVLVPITLLAIVCWHGFSYARDHDAFLAHRERKYAIVGDYVSRRLPARAALLSSLHSGSIRYYSGRPTVRFDLIPETELDATLDELRRHGYHPYLVLESFEVAEFQRRYAGHSPLGALDWPPIALLRASSIRIYDPADLVSSRAGRAPLTEVVP